MPTRAATLYAIAAAFGAAGVSALAAAGGVTLFETQTRDYLVSALEPEDSWLSIDVRGTTAVLTGDAPSVAARRAALTRLGAARKGLVMLDHTGTADAPEDDSPAETPIPFANLALQILVNGEEITLIGEIPQAEDGDGPAALLAELRGDVQLSDMTLAAEGRVPDDWPPSMALALEAAQMLHRGQIAVRAGDVLVDGSVASAELRDPALARLAVARPEGTRLLARLSAPRPLIAPFPFSARISDDGTLKIETCAAPDTAGAELIRARALTLGGSAECQIGLGAPTAEWAKAVVATLNTLEGLGQGRVRITDGDIRLTGPRGMAAGTFEEGTAALAAALPPGYSLTTVLPPPPQTGETGDVEPPRFTAVRSEDGAVRIRGDLFADALKGTALALAEAHFGFEAVVDETTSREDLPHGWSARVVAALDALGRLNQGQVEVTEGEIFVTGTSGSETIEEDVQAALNERLPEGAEARLELWYSEELAVAEEQKLVALPGELCAEQINVMLDGSQIVFPPNADDISEESLPAIDRIAEVLQQCPGARFEIEGHTDSQGRESSNMALSQARAQAVMAALLERGVDMVFLNARGYGEEQPIADNETEEGRARNRRIAFRLIEKDEAADEAQTPEEQSVMAEADTPDGANAGESDSVTTRASIGPTPIIETTTSEDEEGGVERTALSVQDDSLDGSGHDIDETAEGEAPEDAADGAAETASLGDGEADQDAAGEEPAEEAGDATALGDIRDHTDAHDGDADTAEGAADADNAQADEDGASETTDAEETADEGAAEDASTGADADAGTGTGTETDAQTGTEPEETIEYSGEGPGRPRARPEDLPSVQAD
ncbi:OmpA family protein [Halovulum sp. GXIMD14794]